MNIVLAVAPGPKAWSWQTLETQPLGGSETAAIYLADSLAKLGHRVVLRGPVSCEPSPSGVQYVGVSDPSGPTDADVVIVSRVRQWLPAFTAKYKLFWSHDLMNVDDAPRTPQDCDVVLALSRFHSRSFPGRQLALIHNGIDPELFKDIKAGNWKERQLGKMAWTSNFDRGLFPAIRIFQKMRTRWPQLELHVYGGMDVYGWGKEREPLYVPVDRDGVTFHGSLPKRELAQELATCWAWWYPTWWPETYCIAGLEAQAAGTPCITVPVGALTETVHACKPSYALADTIEHLMYRPTWEGESKRAATLAKRRTWDSVAEGVMKVVEVLSGAA